MKEVVDKNREFFSTKLSPQTNKEKLDQFFVNYYLNNLDSYASLLSIGIRAPYQSIEKISYNKREYIFIDENTEKEKFSYKKYNEEDVELISSDKLDLNLDTSRVTKEPSEVALLNLKKYMDKIVNYRQKNFEYPQTEQSVLRFKKNNNSNYSNFFNFAYQLRYNPSDSVESYIGDSEPIGNYCNPKFKQDFKDITDYYVSNPSSSSKNPEMDKKYSFFENMNVGGKRTFYIKYKTKKNVDDLSFQKSEPYQIIDIELLHSSSTPSESVKYLNPDLIELDKEGRNLMKELFEG